MSPAASAPATALGIGRVRRDALPGELGESGISVLRAVKRALDPGGLLNPGALLPEEDRVQYSAMTGQSLFYMGEQDLRRLRAHDAPRVSRPM